MSTENSKITPLFSFESAMGVHLEVKQANVFTNARYDYTAIELDIMYCLMFKLKQKEFAENEVTIPLSMLQKYKNCEVKKKDIAEALRKWCRRNMYFEEYSKDGQLSFKFIQFIAAAYMPPEGGRIFIEVPKFALQYYKPLENQWTTFRLQMALGFKSKFTKRLYPLLSKNKNMQTWRVDLVTLKELLGLINMETRKEQFTMVYTFCERVLDTAMVEMKTKESDVQFTYDTVKTGRYITHINFYITYNANNVQLKITDDTVYSYLTNTLKLSDYQAREIVLNVSEANIKRLATELIKEFTAGKINNLGAISALRFRENFNLTYRVGEKVGDVILPGYGIKKTTA